MKYYFIYLKIPNKLYETKYIHFIPNKHDYQKFDDVTIGLYAFTKNKKMANIFLKERSFKYFTMIEKELNRYDEDRLTEINYLLELDYREYDTVKNGKKEIINILSTLNEFNIIEYNFNEYIYEFGPYKYACVDYHLFNDKIIEALNIIDYVKHYVDQYGSDDDVDEMYYMESFGLSLNGTKKTHTNSDKLSGLVYLFYELF